MSNFNKWSEKWTENFLSLNLHPGRARARHDGGSGHGRARLGRPVGRDGAGRVVVGDRDLLSERS